MAPIKLPTFLWDVCDYGIINAITQNMLLIIISALNPGDFKWHLVYNGLQECWNCNLTISRTLFLLRVQKIFNCIRHSFTHTHKYRCALVSHHIWKPSTLNYFYEDYNWAQFLSEGVRHNKLPSCEPLPFIENFFFQRE